MSKTLRYASATWIVGAAVFNWIGGCSSSTPPKGSGNPADSGTSPTGDSGSSPTGDGATTPSDGATNGEAASADGPTYKYTLIDDMETTTHGPIKLPGIDPPEKPGYWFNFGGTAPGDMLTPPYQSFVFSAVAPPTTTLMGKTSAHAAHELCTLGGQYDVCGVGFEFAQVNALDAGPDAGCVVEAADAAPEDAGDSGSPICETTVPFDISQYKGITFWGKTTAGGATTLDVKVLFPDTFTDPRGNICNSAAAGASGPTDTSQCYNSYAETVTLTGAWTQFTVMLADLKQDSTFGYILPPDGGADAGSWSGTNVYGINWQGQDNNAPGAATVTMDIWLDDVYFIQ
jgi:hypothetical protein